MEQNPYAAPQVFPDAAPVPSGPVGPWRIGDAFREMKRLAVQRWPVVFVLAGGTCLVKRVIRLGVHDLFKPYLAAPPHTTNLHVMFSRLVAATAVLVAYEAVRLLVQTPLGCIVIRFYGAAIRGEPLKADLVDSALTRTIPVFLSAFPATLATQLGREWSLVPGLVAFLALCWAPFFAMEPALAPFASLRASWRLTREKGGMRLVAVAGAVYLLTWLLSHFGGLAGLTVATIIADLLLNVVFTLATGRVPARATIVEPLVAERR